LRVAARAKESHLGRAGLERVRGGQNIISGDRISRVATLRWRQWRSRLFLSRPRFRQRSGLEPVWARWPDRRA